MDRENTLTETIRNNRLMSIVVGLLILGLILYFLYSLFNNQEDSQLSQITQNPDDFINQTVDVRGEVDEVIGSRAISLNSPNATDPNVLVISKAPIVPVGGGDDESMFTNEDRVRVVGEVRRFSLRDVEEELGSDLIDEEFEDWEGEPVIIAENIERNL